MSAAARDRYQARWLGQLLERAWALAPGVRQRIEYPVDGKDVWVTRTVKDAAGNVIHQETYASHYARITGVVLVGQAAADTTAVADPPPADPAPTPTP